MEKPQHTQAQLRESNLALVLSQLRIRSPLSRAQLAKQTHLNKSTISNLTGELLALGLLHEVGLDTSGGGRPARLLAINPHAGHVVACELGVDFLLTIVTDFGGSILWRTRLATEPTHAQDVILAQLLATVREAIAFSRQSQQRLLGIGVTLPGMVDVENGVLLFSPNLQWHDVPLRQMLEEQVNLPVYVENDANAAALGEHFFGGASQVRDFIFILADVGLGGGLFLNGDLYRGTRGLAGEIGHMELGRYSDRPCRCGKRGCWEMEVNKTSIVNRVRTLLDVRRSSIIPTMMAERACPLTLALILEAATAGDGVALEALTETGRVLGLGISNLINTFNPELIVLGGVLSQVGEYLLPAIRETLAQKALLAAHEQTEVALSVFGTDAIVIGAATLVVRAVLSNPKSVEYLPHAVSLASLTFSQEGGDRSADSNAVLLTRY